MGSLCCVQTIDNSYKPPVPTAQNALRQGEFVALLFNALFSGVSPPGAAGGAKVAGTGGAKDPATEPAPLLAPLPAYIETRGIALCFLGKNSAALQLPFLTFVGGGLAVPFWRFVYLQLQANRQAVWQCLGGWIRTAIFGRALPSSV